MDDQHFWKIIELFDWPKAYDNLILSVDTAFTWQIWQKMLVEISVLDDEGQTEEALRQMRYGLAEKLENITKIYLETLMLRTNCTSQQLNLYNEILADQGTTDL